MRQCGVLMHITSLPSPAGIGSLGQEAFEFIRFCRAAGVRVWQMLPVGPTGYGESPYQSTSSFAGEELMIDLTAIAKEAGLKPPTHPATEQVDFAVVRKEKTALLKQAYKATRKAHEQELRAFREAHPWVEDYALFSAIKERYGGVMWTQWPDEGLRRRDEAALAQAREELRDAIERHVFAQWLFDTQWQAMRAFAKKNGVRLFGDMPIYIAEDSVDTWLYPELFQLDADGRPTHVAGVPPDLFSSDGQKWGNPLYDWDAHARQGYRWWLERLQAASERFDMLRIDHFIGFANYYSIPANAPNARTGRWHVGPNRRLFRVLKQSLTGLSIVAEDLGRVTWRVRRLLQYCGYPGMRVLSFAFGSGARNPHLPSRYPARCVAYTGTHDNDTVRGWYATANDAQRKQAEALLGFRGEQDAPWAFIRAVAASRADAAVFPMQDLLALSTDARMNLPGTIGGNWVWRMLPGAANADLAERLRALNKVTGRLQD